MSNFSPNLFVVQSIAFQVGLPLWLLIIRDSAGTT